MRITHKIGITFVNVFRFNHVSLARLALPYISARPSRPHFTAASGGGHVADRQTRASAGVGSLAMQQALGGDRECAEAQA